MSKNVESKNSWIWSIVGFLFPIIGIILFCIWNSNKKKNAKMSIIGACIGIALQVLFYLVGWPLIQKAIVENTCQTYGEEYHAYKSKYNWCCKNSEGKIINAVDDTICPSYEE